MTELSTPLTEYEAFLVSLSEIPDGISKGDYKGRSYIISHTIEAQGQREKLWAEELGGQDYISFNLYRLKNGKTLFKPCEMPEIKVTNFVQNVNITSR